MWEQHLNKIRLWGSLTSKLLESQSQKLAWGLGGQGRKGKMGETNITRDSSKKAYGNLYTLPKIVLYTYIESENKFAL